VGRLDAFDQQAVEEKYGRDMRHAGQLVQVPLCDSRKQLTPLVRWFDLSLEQARRQADNFRGQIALGIDPAAKKTTMRTVPTFADFMAERYMPFVKGYKRSWMSDDSYLRNHLLPALGKKHLDEISKHDVIAFHHGTRTKGYALGTCNRCLIMLRYALNLAVRWEIPGVTVNPTKDVPLFEDPNKKERFLSQEEAQRLYAAVCESDNPMLRYIVPMLILTGARKREVLDAKWEDFDIVAKQWRIPITKAGKPRYVPLSTGAVQLLASIPHQDNCPWVFANLKTLMPYVSFYHSWNTARKQAGLADVRIHDLRHSFASFLVNAGRSLYEVQKILGHTQVKTTQRYAHLSQDTLIDAANAAMNAMGSSFAPPVLTLPQPK
jgi:integrase